MWRHRMRSDLSKRTSSLFVLPGVLALVGLAAPHQVVGAISGITGVPADVVAANTQLMLVAIGQFLADAPAAATYHGESFSVQTTLHFQVRLRMVFRFTPPPGVPAPPVGIIVGFMTRGMLGQLVPS